MDNKIIHFCSIALAVALVCGCSDDENNPGEEPVICSVGYTYDVEATACTATYAVVQGESDATCFYLDFVLPVTGGGADARISLTLQAKEAVSAESPRLAVGEYALNYTGAFSDCSIVGEESFCTGLGTSRRTFNQASLTVSEEGGTYVFRGFLMLDNLETVQFVYSGTVTPEADLVVRLKSEFCEMKYWSDIYHTGNDNFTLYLGTAEHQDMYVMGTGEFITLSLQAPAADHYENARIVPGTYAFDTQGTFADWTMGYESQRMQYLPDADGDRYMEEVQNWVEDGTLTLTELYSGLYSVEADLLLDDGQRMLVTYIGAIDFTNSYKNMMPDMIAADKEFTCGFGTATYQGQGFYYLDLMSGGDPYVSMDWANRDRMSIYLYTDGNAAAIPAGTYQVNASTEPGNCVPGEVVIEGSSSYIDGSRYYIVDNSYNQLVGLFTSGTVTVAQDGGVYSITVDVTDVNGHAIKAAYTGALEIIDNTDDGE